MPCGISSRFSPPAGRTSMRYGRNERLLESLRHRPPNSAGKVATYGQIARLAGMPRCARTVGYAMAGCKDATVPCHRVVDRFGGTKACFDTHSPVPSERCWRQRECFFAWTGPWTWNGVSGSRPSPYSENIGSLFTSATVSASAVSIPRKPPFSWEASPSHAKSTCNPVVFLGR